MTSWKTKDKQKVTDYLDKCWTAVDKAKAQWQANNLDKAEVLLMHAVDQKFRAVANITSVEINAFDSISFKYMYELWKRLTKWTARGFSWTLYRKPKSIRDMKQWIKDQLDQLDRDVEDLVERAIFGPEECYLHIVDVYIELQILIKLFESGDKTENKWIESNKKLYQAFWDYLSCVNGDDIGAEDENNPFSGPAGLSAKLLLELDHTDDILEEAWVIIDKARRKGGKLDREWLASMFELLADDKTKLGALLDQVQTH